MFKNWKVYQLTFDNGQIYIGMTKDIKKRFYTHIHNSHNSRIKKVLNNEYPLLPNCRVLYDFLEEWEARELEAMEIQKYARSIFGRMKLLNKVYPKIENLIFPSNIHLYIEYQKQRLESQKKYQAAIKRLKERGVEIHV